MPSSFWFPKRRLIEWLMLVLLAVYLVSSAVVMYEEGRIFADPSRHVLSESHSVTLQLKGAIFFVSAKDKATHELAKRVSLGALAVLFIGVGWVRLSQGNVARP